MNILIVDDEALSVNGIAAALDWQTLGISHVYKAYNMAQAQEIFRQYPVELLLCDIEMPRGSGIDLIQWVQDEGYTPVSIFLTCFSHFDYAASAIRLQVFDYVLKPCEYHKLAEVIARAAARVQENQAQKQKETLSGYWVDDYRSLVTGFWNDLLHGIIPSDKAALARILHQRHLDTALLNADYYLLFIQITADKEMDPWDDDLWCFAIQNIMLESLDSDMIIIPGKAFIAIVPGRLYPTPDAFEQSCRALIHNLQSILPAQFFGYMAAPCTTDQAYSVFQGLKKDAAERYALESSLFVHGRNYNARTLPDIAVERWQNALLSYNIDIILDDIQDFVTPQGPEQYIDSHLLHLIYHQLIKSIYYVLEINNLPTHQPFLSQETEASENAFQSIADFRIWAQIVTEKTVALISGKEPSSMIIKQLTRYIQDNINNDLTRAELTRIVHLHPDYMSSMFRQKMGISLSEYITRERIRAAKKLLRSTDLPINEIATRTGFQTISYFSKQFKRLENMTPFQFRKQ